MSDPDRMNDTEPTGCPLAGGQDADTDADEATTQNDTSRGDVAADSSDHDTDDFLRWLPTLALSHRRRAELVARPSSDGADFAAYACEGRPAAASGQLRLESAVNVKAKPGAKDLERDAPTVLTRERRARHWWRSVGWGVAAAGAALTAWWAWRPVATEKAPRREQALATAPVPIRATATEPAEPLQPKAAPIAAASQASPTPMSRTAAEQRALPSSEAVTNGSHKKDSVGPPKAIASSARERTSPLTAAPTVPAKDQYFEAP